MRAECLTRPQEHGTFLNCDPASQAAALAALERVDLRDGQPLQYLHTVNQFAVLGLDTTSAAFRVLDDRTHPTARPGYGRRSDGLE